MLMFLLLGGGALLIAVIVIYNGLVTKRNMVRNAFSTIDVNLRKRHDLIPNLVETVKAYAAHEKDTFTELSEARNRAQSGNLSDSERLREEEKIGPRVNRLLAVAEAYPELRSNRQFLNLQRNLSEVEEQLSAARRAYNAAVFDNNNAVETFPGVFFAQTFNFKRQYFFEASGNERASKNVKF